MVSTIMNKSIPSVNFVDFSKLRNNDALLSVTLGEKESAVGPWARAERRAKERRTARLSNRRREGVLFVHEATELFLMLRQRQNSKGISKIEIVNSRIGI
jgi:hypothetical protein